MAFPILTFYKFTQVSNPIDLAEKMRVLLAEESALGTVLLSKEGVNGSLTASDKG